MENSMSPSLNIILEEEGKEDSAGFGDEELFKADDEDKEDSEVNLDSKSDEDKEEVAGEEGTDSNSESEALSSKLSNFEELAKNLKDVSSYLRSVSDKTDIFQVQDFLSNDIASKSQDTNLKSEIEFEDDEGIKVESKYSLKRKNKISYFLNEKINIKDVEKDIEAVDNIIDKGSDLIDKFKKGTEINILQYVESSINAYRNFDNLFSKESIIKQAAMNLIILNSGAKADKNISEFEELFHEELHKQFGIEYEEHAVITKPHHVATGAVKQG
jgi:hypothetical protein